MVLILASYRDLRSSASSSGLPPVTSGHALQKGRSASAPKRSRTISETVAALNASGRIDCAAGSCAISQTSLDSTSGSSLRAVVATSTPSPSSLRSRYAMNRKDARSHQCRSSIDRHNGRSAATFTVSQKGCTRSRTTHSSPGRCRQAARRRAPPLRPTPPATARARRAPATSAQTAAAPRQMAIPVRARCPSPPARGNRPRPPANELRPTACSYRSRPGLNYINNSLIRQCALHDPIEPLQLPVVLEQRTLAGHARQHSHGLAILGARKRSVRWSIEPRHLCKSFARPLGAQTPRSITSVARTVVAKLPHRAAQPWRPRSRSGHWHHGVVAAAQIADRRNQNLFHAAHDYARWRDADSRCACSRWGWNPRGGMDERRPGRPR